MTTSSRKFKDTIYEQLGRIGKAVSSPRRLELLELLCQGPRTVEALTREIVAYCRGPYYVLAVNAVEVLLAPGFRPVRLEEGVPDWRARGFEVAVGEESV